MSIKDLIKDKPAKERAKLKGLEIAKIKKANRQNVKFSGTDYDIEIVGTKAIEGGVEVFARAWSPDGSQIGFGKDGSVDIERFRFFNPPIMVPDGTKTLTKDEKGRDILNDNLKEDVELAILQSLAHVIKVKKQKFGSDAIVSERIGNTTSTFYPAAGANSPVDGRISNYRGDVTWADIHDDTTGSGVNVTSTSIETLLASSTTSNQWEELNRGVFLFDTSAIGSDTVDSATLSLYGSTVTDNFNQLTGIVSVAPASNNNLAVGDYDSFGTTRYATDIDLGSVSTVAYNDFALNASGLSAIDTSGISKFGSRLSSDIDDSPPSWSSATAARATWKSADTDGAGTTNDPKLVVEHSSAATATGNFFLMF